MFFEKWKWSEKGVRFDYQRGVSNLNEGEIVTKRGKEISRKLTLHQKMKIKSKEQKIKSKKPEN